jgi:hypothetical protein
VTGFLRGNTHLFLIRRPCVTLRTSLTIFLVLIASFAMAASPTVTFSTYFGSTAPDDIVDIAVDGTGNSYVLVKAGSTDLPTTLGAYSRAGDILVAKFSPSGGLIYSTYLGFNGLPSAIVVDGSGRAVVTGSMSGTFPSSTGAYQRTHKGNWDVFVVKVNAGGSGLTFATLLGGSGDTTSGQEYEDARELALDGSGNVYVTGYTNSKDFPTTAGSWNPGFDGTKICGDTTSYVCPVGFLTKLNGSGTALVYSTFVGGNFTQPEAVTVDSSGYAYVAGYAGERVAATSGAVTMGNGNFFIAKITPSGAGRSWIARVGGDDSDQLGAIGIDSGHNVYIAGDTQSRHWPTTANAFQHRDYSGPTTNFTDLFVVKVNASGSSIGYSTVIGGSDSERIGDMRVDSSGFAYVTGATVSADYPTKNAVRSTIGGNDTVCGSGNCGDVVVTKLNQTGSALEFSTYWGGGGPDVGVTLGIDGNKNIYVAGFTYSSDFPTTSGAFDRSLSGDADSFLTKFNMSGTGTSTCAVPTTVGVKICTPTNNATVASPVAISASAKGNATITTMKIYRDGTSVYSSKGNTLNTSLTMTAGTHRLTVQAYDSAGANYKTTIYVTVK